MIPVRTIHVHFMPILFDFIYHSVIMDLYNVSKLILGYSLHVMCTSLENNIFGEYM